MAEEYVLIAQDPDAIKSYEIQYSQDYSALMRAAAALQRRDPRTRVTIARVVARSEVKATMAVVSAS